MSKKLKKITTKTDLKKHKFVDLWRKTDGNVTKICDALSMDRHTYYRWMKKDADFVDELRIADENVNDRVKGVLMKKIFKDEDMTATIFYLKYKHPEFKRQAPVVAVQVNYNKRTDEQKQDYNI